MSPRFAGDDVDAVRERADIVEIISEHVRLKPAGRSHKGLCPFHQEKTASFSVDRAKGVYYCFGCGASGNVFTFVEEVEGLSFPEAVETLARRYGVTLREVSGGRKAPSARARLISLHEAAVERCQRWLAEPDAEPVRAYLAGRGIGDDRIQRYLIGFGGWHRDGLVRVMLRAGFRGEELITGGLATRDGRTMRDTFFGRVVFPIYDPSDRPVGFGGRVLPDVFRRHGAPEGPKYLNSRETPIFRKSRILYGANWARGEVVKRRRLVLVEGYTDVIALQAAGIQETVATCGTSLTEQHMKEISTRFGDVRVILCLDADAAGQAAMSRERTEELAGSYSPGERVAGGGWLPVGRGWLPEVYVASLPEGKDPADFVEAEGADGVGRLLDRAVPIAEFLLRRVLQGEDCSTPEGRTRAVRKGVGVLAEVGDSLLRHEYALWLADRTGVDTYEVNRALEGQIAKGPRRREPAAAQGPVALSGHHRVEREALRALVDAPELLADGAFAVSEQDFTLPLHRSLYRLAAAEVQEHGAVDLGRLSSRVQDPDLRRAVSELAGGPTPDARAARETVVRLKDFTLGRHIVERKERLRSLHPDRDAEAYDALFEELLELEKSRRSLRNEGATDGG